MTVKKTKEEIFLFAFLIASLCLACDPGYQLKPIGWAPAGEHRWSKDMGDFVIQTRGFGGLIGESWAAPDFEIHNNSQPIVVERVELRTKDGVYPAKLWDENRSVPVGGSKGCCLGITWEFDKRTAEDVLGDRCEVIMKLKVGSENREIRIEFER